MRSSAPCAHNRCLQLLPSSHNPDRLQSRAGLNPSQPEFGFSRQRKTYRGSMHGAAWECCIHKWEAEGRTGSDILGHITASVTGLTITHGTALGFKTSAGWGKEDARWFPFAAEIMWHIVHLLPGKQTAGSRFLFHAWRSSEVLLLRVSCVIIFRPRPAVALTEVRSWRKRTRVVIERNAARWNYCSVGRHGNPSHNKLSITDTRAAGRLGLLCRRCIVNVTYPIFIHSDGAQGRV